MSSGGVNPDSAGGARPTLTHSGGAPPPPGRRSAAEPTAMLPPPVGDGVPDVPPSRSPPALPSSASPDRAQDDLAAYYAAHGPFPTRRRGRRHRRPFPSSTASPTAARIGCGRLRPPAKGEPPARVPPLTPSCASLAQGAFRALRRASKGSAPGPRPLFCKKAGQKTFKRQFSTSPNPSPLGRVIQSVREADTLAAEWQLPHEWERRVGPETSRGRHHPKSAFLWGSTPFLWARPKKWGGTCSTNVKSSRAKRRVPPTPNPQHYGHKRKKRV